MCDCLNNFTVGRARRSVYLFEAVPVPAESSRGRRRARDSLHAADTHKQGYRGLLQHLLFKPGCCEEGTGVALSVQLFLAVEVREGDNA